MEDRLITTKEVGNYRIKIYYDTDMECPCKSWDMAACFLWEYSDSYQLQDVAIGEKYLVNTEMVDTRL